MENGDKYAVAQSTFEHFSDLCEEMNLSEEDWREYFDTLIDWLVTERKEH